MQYNFYGTDLYVNVRKGVFRTQCNIRDGASLWKSQKSVIVNVRLGSKYASGISSTAGRVHRMSIFVQHSQSQLWQSKKCVIDFLVFNKKYVGLPKKLEFVFRFFVAAASFRLKAL